MDGEHRKELDRLVKEYGDMFQDKSGKTTLAEHRIEVEKDEAI